MEKKSKVEIEFPLRRFERDETTDCDVVERTSKKQKQQSLGDLLNCVNLMIIRIIVVKGLTLQERGGNIKNFQDAQIN